VPCENEEEKKRRARGTLETIAMQNRTEPNSQDNRWELVDFRGNTARHRLRPTYVMATAQGSRPSSMLLRDARRRLAKLVSLIVVGIIYTLHFFFFFEKKFSRRERARERAVSKGGGGF